jgi:hypothetical protein
MSRRKKTCFEFAGGLSSWLDYQGDRPARNGKSKQASALKASKFIAFDPHRIYFCNVVYFTFIVDAHQLICSIIFLQHHSDCASVCVFGHASTPINSDD